MNLKVWIAGSLRSDAFSRYLHWTTVGPVVMLVMAALVRFDEIQAPGHLMEREYNSAIFARAFYFEGNTDVDPWRREMARLIRDRLPVLEPPITEYLVSLIYRIRHHEDLWVARYLTSAFWLIGGLVFYELTKRLLSAVGAVLALAYYLFVPMGIITSRSFQPDALMMMVFLISLAGIIGHATHPSWRRLLLAGSLTGASLLIRPLILFALLGAFVALSINRKGRWTRIVDKQLAVFFILSLALPGAFYGYSLAFANFPPGQFYFRPYLLTRWHFWQGWIELATQVTLYPALVASLFGFSLLRHRPTKSLIAGLAVGYVVFGLFFTYNIHTHPYYHIQLFPVIGLGIGALATEIRTAWSHSLGNNWRLPATASALILLFGSYREVRGSLYHTVFEDPRVAQEIGAIVQHSSRTVFVAYHYGLPLEYYGELSGGPWPVRIDDPFYRRPGARELTVEERIDDLGFEPEYYVITNVDDYRRRHPDLELYLTTHCSVLAQTPQYLIFQSCDNPVVGAD